jgi:ABC-2 type transport system permease protein
MTTTLATPSQTTSTATEVTSQRPVGLRSNAAALAARNITVIRRRPQLMVYAVIQPIIVLLLFRYVLGGSIKIPGISYANYLVPGIIVASLAFGSISTAVGFAEDLHTGVVDRLRTLPISRSAVIVGRVASDAVRIVFIVAVLIGIGYAVGFRFTTDAAHIIGFAAVAILIGIVYTSLAILIGASVDSPEAASSAGTMMVMPLLFASSSLVATSSMPRPLRFFANNNPVTHFSNTLRALAHGGPVANPLVKTLIWSAIILIGSSYGAIRRYNRR